MSVATSLFPVLRNCCLASAPPRGLGETASAALYFRTSARLNLAPSPRRRLGFGVAAFAGDSALRVGGREAPARNRYARLRSLLPAASSAGNSRTSANDVAQKAVAALTRKSRTWQRLGPVVDLACSSSDGETIQTIADVGTDHGLLAIALAVTGRYDWVVGTDASEAALRQGARAFHHKVLDVLRHGSTTPPGGITRVDVLPLEFRVGDGLRPLAPGNADAVVVCGMGVATMGKILSKNELERLGTRRLYLQPTNSRPRNLMALYDSLQHDGWRLHEERIQRVSGRWYISSAFHKAPIQRGGGNLALPGDKLQLSDVDAESTRQEHQRYVEHHLTWLERDLRTRGHLDPADQRWRKKYST